MIGVAGAAVAASGPACAATATSLSSFEGREEPTVLFHPSNDTFTNDSLVNITDQSGGVIRYTLRYQPNQDWWDGDRNTTNDDRQRAEVKGLGIHQKNSQTFRYSFDWRTDPNYIGTGSFCHIFQLKSTDGDSVRSAGDAVARHGWQRLVADLVGRREQFVDRPYLQVDAEHMVARGHPHHHGARQHGLGDGIDQRRWL